MAELNWGKLSGDMCLNYNAQVKPTSSICWSSSTLGSAHDCNSPEANIP